MNLICFSDVAWNFLWQRQHHFIANMPPDWKILYVEPSFLKSLALKIINLYSHVEVPNTKNGNIHIVSFPLIPIIDKWKKLRKLNELIFVQSIKLIMAINQIEDPIFLFYCPRFVCTLKMIKHSLAAYDIIDDKMEFEAVPKWLETYHSSLINEANLVTVSSSYLFEKIKARRKNDTFLVGNGVDAEHFSLQEPFNGSYVDLSKIKPPIIGYIGAIGEWFDFDLLEKVIDSHKGISTVLIGWVFRKQRNSLEKLLKRHKNMYFLGRRSYHLLPSYISNFSAGIIPFKIDELTRSINPVKLLEYLAAGIPVISTAMPELLKYGEGVYIAETSEQFNRLLDKALTLPHDKKKLAETAFENDWKHKSSQFVNLLERYLNQKHA